MLQDKYHDRIQDVLARYPSRRSAVLPLLFLAQQEYGYCTEAAMREVAELVGMEPTEVFSVAGFYSLFNKEPTGRYVLDICNDLPCALRGADKFLDYVCQKLGVKPGETTPDGLFTVRPAMCLAACDRAPMMQVNLDYYEHLDEAKFDALVEELRRKAARDAGGTP